MNDNNYHYGKRAILSEKNFSKKLLSVVENNNLLKFISQLYNTEPTNLSFHNGSLTRVYPGCTGEAGQYHIDTPGFMYDRETLLDPNRL